MESGERLAVRLAARGPACLTVTQPVVLARGRVTVRLRADGLVTISGTGPSAVFAVLGADRLGIPADRVQPGHAVAVLSPAGRIAAVQAAADDVTDVLVRFAVRTFRSPFHGQTTRYEDGRLVTKTMSMTFGAFLTAMSVAGVEATAG